MDCQLCGFADPDIGREDGHDPRDRAAARPCEADVAANRIRIFEEPSAGHLGAIGRDGHDLHRVLAFECHAGTPFVARIEDGVAGAVGLAAVGIEQE